MTIKLIFIAYLKSKEKKHKFKYIADKYNMFDEFVFSASPDFFNGMSKEDIIKYFKDNIKILKTHFFKVEGSIVSAVIHFDEKTPHCHVLAIPMIEEQKIIKRGKEKGKIVEGQKKISLSHDKILGTKEKCRRLQSIFNFELKNLGYEVHICLKNTGIKHQSQKEYNRQITEFNKIDDQYLKIEKNLNEIKNLSFIEKIKNINKIIDTIQKHVEKINKFYRAYISTKSINKKIKNENEYLKLRLNNQSKSLSKIRDEEIKNASKLMKKFVYEIQKKSENLQEKNQILELENEKLISKMEENKENIEFANYIKEKFEQLFKDYKLKRHTTTKLKSKITI